MLLFDFVGLTRLRTLVCVALVVVQVFGGCVRSSDPATSGTESLAWIDGGVESWAENLSREPVEERDGFAAMCALAEWVRNDPAPADDLEAERRWAERYAQLVGEIASSRHWSGEPRWNATLAAYSGDRNAEGLSDGVCFASTGDIIAVFRACERMMDVLGEKSPESSAALARDLFRLGEMIGRNGADKDKLLAQMQLTSGAVASEGMLKSVVAGASPDQAAHYTAIRDGVVAYVRKESLKLRPK
ncbi:MAG: hypothetical protein KIT19_13150 [Phycisphaeraceae bacterium]|nr:hypothetical protein [Phycisphaeraceae bacterium]